MLALTLALVIAQTSAIDRGAGWSMDASALLGALHSQHYVLRRAPLPDSIRAAADRFRAHVVDWSDDRALAELMRLAAMAGDGHTYVLPYGGGRIGAHVLPIRLYQFSDGMFAIDALPGHEQWIGARVESLGGVATPRLVQHLRPYIARDNDAGGILFASATLLGFQGFIEAVTERRFDSAVPARLHLRDGRDTSVALPLFPVPPLRGVPKLISSRLSDAPPPRWLRNIDTPLWFEPVGDTVLYVQFNKVWNSPQVTLADGAARLERAIGEQHTRLLIVDVRQNNGGNLNLLDPLIAVLRRFSEAPGHGRLVVLSGRHTFSAAEIFLARAEHEAHAEIAGEPSASKPNFVGEENAIRLPWSGAVASVSNRYHESIPGDTRQWIEPHPKIFLSSREYFANRDPVLEALIGRQ